MKLIFKERFLMLLLLTAITTTVFAQRFTDNLNRGLVAVVPRNGSGVFLSWRIQPYEYYDVKYNVYKNGEILAENLDVSNYLDASGSALDIYKVKAVVNNTEGEESLPARFYSVDPKPDNYRYGAGDYLPGGQPGHLSILMQDVVDRDGNIVFCACGNHTTSQNYSINDGCLADLDGDGDVEIIVKRINETDATADMAHPNGTEIYKYGQKAFTIFEAYKLDGSNTRLWWIDCGPNMVSLNSTEVNCVAYDWDEDGKAEVLLRGADNMIVHTNDDKAILIGNEIDLRKALYRTKYQSGQSDEQGPSQFAWTRVGKEYLLFLKGATGLPYKASDKNISAVTGKSYGFQYIPEDFPLKRLESTSVTEINTEAQAAQSQDKSSNSDLYKYLDALNTEWGDSYGHRCNKFFFGAPFLDGKKASVFLARGIYSRIKMAALDVDFNQNNGTYSVTSTKTWSNSTAGSPWYGQGNHNFSIADVDGDGCDEIIYGSMTIDNNMKGLSTTGLGHGDAIHVGDFDPFRKGMEVFACNEDNKGNNYRNATTSEILYRNTASEDDGRAMMGNFTNDYPGSTGRTVSSGVISSVTSLPIPDYSDPENFIKWSWLNGRIYWDGDLCEEYYDSPGSPGQLAIAKVGFSCSTCNTNRIMQARESKMNNGSKNNPCAQGDIIGDWREELVVRSSDDKSLMIFSTDEPTEWRIPSLWYDHEYRQAMVWQPCAYNQPPHASFFLGEMEGITRAPLPLTNRTGTGKNDLRIEPASGSDINQSNYKDKTVMLCDNNGANASFSIGTSNMNDANSPALLIVNARSTVNGQNESNSTTNLAPLASTYSTVSITGNKFSGSKMRLVKQGDGKFAMTVGTHSYGGDTEIWGGSVQLRGTLSNSKVWMNRHTQFYCAATINQPMTMEYGAEIIYPLYEKSGGSWSYFSPTIPTLNMNEGARLVLQYENEGNINITDLNIRKRTEKNWILYGPKYNAPVFEIKPQNKLKAGRYKLGTIKNITGGTIDDIIPECSNVIANAIIYLEKDETTNEVFMVVENGGEVVVDSQPGDTWELDFETNDIDGNKYGFSTSTDIDYVWSTSSLGGHCLYLRHKSGGGQRDTNRNFSESVFSEDSPYTFDFYWGMIAAELSGTVGTQDSYTELVSNKGSLFNITTTGKHSSLDASVCGVSSLYVGNTFVCNLDNDGINVNKCPTTFTHFIVNSSDAGTYLTVINKNGTKLVDNRKINDGFVKITALNNKLGRTGSRLALDNMKMVLNNAKVTTSVSLLDIEIPKIPAGTYDIMNVTRSNFKAGYNTFCIPMNTTPEDVAGSDAKAYKFSRVQSNGNTSSLIFEEVNVIEANKPYLIYCQNEVEIPTLFNNVTVSVAKPVTVEADGWKFISNYEPGKAMNGNYMVYNNNNEGQLRQGGKNATLNGLRAYFVAPAAANAKTLVLSFYETTGIVNTIIANDEANGVAGIYSINGIPQKSLGKGINIVKMSNGNVKKIYIK